MGDFFTRRRLSHHDAGDAAMPSYSGDASSHATRAARPPRGHLYVQRFVALDDFARDVKNGTIASYGKMEAEEKRRLFGTTIVPIFVPLAPGETAEQYERRFADWLQRHHGVTVTELVHHDDDKRERYFRMRFATANGRGVERFDPTRDGNDADDRAPRPLHSEPPRPSAASSGSHPSRSIRHPYTGEQVPRKAFYVKKYVELEQFTSDLKVGKIGGYAQMPDAAKMELFGSTIVPIFVPLARGESIRQYEDRFVQWLARQGHSLRDIENHEDALLERQMWIKFASLNARGIERFFSVGAKREHAHEAHSSQPMKKVVRFQDEVPLFAEVPSREKPSLSSSKESVERSSKESHPSPTTVQLSAQPLPSTTTVREKDPRRASSITGTAPTSNTPRERSAPVQHFSSSDDSQKGRFVTDPTTGKRVRREELYAKKYVELDQDALAYKSKIKSYMNMTDEQRQEMFGSTILPIFVPLARGESIRQYEERFVKWLGRQGHTLHEVENHEDPNRERELRILFADLNAKGIEEFERSGSKRERPRDKNSQQPTTKPTRDESKSAQSTSSSTRVADSAAHRSPRTDKQTSSSPPPSKDTKDSASASKVKSAREHVSSTESSDTRSTRRDCSFVAPPDGSLASKMASSYIACGCRQCLVDGMRFLTKKVAELGGDACSNGTTKSPASGDQTPQVVDLTEDDDSRSPQNNSSRFAHAITKLVTSKDTVANIQEQLTTAKDDVTDISNDPVTLYLMTKYEKFNESVMKHEKMLGDLMAKLVRVPVTDTKETTRLQDETQALRQIIHRDSDDRSAILAKVLVYEWRHKRDDLEQQVRGNETKNVLHVQRECHEKCSKLSSVIKAKRQSIDRAKKDLNEAMSASSDGDGGYGSQLASLSRLGKTLTKAESELRELLVRQKSEFSRLIEHDEHLRELVTKELSTSL